MLSRLLVFILLAVLALGCSTDKEEVRVRLTLRERERVDKQVRTYMDSIRPLLDSACAANSLDRVALATDSIVQRRLEEEARLRARIPENLRNGR